MVVCARSCDDFRQKKNLYMSNKDPVTIGKGGDLLETNGGRPSKRERLWGNDVGPHPQKTPVSQDCPAKPEPKIEAKSISNPKFSIPNSNPNEFAGVSNSIPKPKSD